MRSGDDWGNWIMLANERSRGNSQKPGIGWSIAALIMTAIAVHLLREGVPGVGTVVSGDTGLHRDQSIFYSFCWLAGALACFRLGRGSGHWLSSLATAGIALTLAGITAAFAAHTSYANSSRSSYTQAHGVAETATIPGGGSYTTNDNRTWFTVNLNQPVSGHVSTAVYSPGFITPPSDGSSFVIRIDPRDAGYAELLGQPYQTDGETESIAAFAAITLACGIAGIVQAGRARSRERNWRRSPA